MAEPSYEITLREIGVPAPIGRKFRLPTLPAADTFIDWNGSLWRVVGATVRPYPPTVARYGRSVSVPADVLVVPGVPPWAPLKE